jgi:7-cyano-7-deazaguanine synthase
MTEGALVLFSGGQDSTTCLAWALERFDRVETIGFDYGQRHRIELDCRDTIKSEMLDIKSTWRQRWLDDHLIALDALGAVSQTALTQDMEIKLGDDGLPNAFVPGRNLLFLTFAAAVAYRRSLRHLVGGMCETDFSGYPDCRDDAIKALQVAINLGMQSRMILHTPLMWLDKSATWELARTLGGERLVGVVREATHTCYQGNRTERHDWGYGCGQCPACLLREKGYHEFEASHCTETGHAVA